MYLKIVKNRFLKIVLIALILEIFVFNFKHWESHFFDDIGSPVYSVGVGLERVSKNTFKIIDRDNAFFDISNIDGNVKNILFDIKADSESVNNGMVIPIQIEITDEANELFLRLPEVKVVEGIKESSYIRLHSIGKSSKLRVWVRRNNDEAFRINTIALNKIRPMAIHIKRIVILTLAGVLYCLFRPKSKIYNIVLDYSDTVQKRIIISIISLNMLIMCGIGLSALPHKYWKDDPWEAHAQYEDLTDALLDGHFYLNQIPPKSLQDIKNPYDCTVRLNKQSETGDNYLFDFAYYKGKYYCYFGIVPALLFFLPFKLIMGYHLETWIAVVMCAVLYCISAFVFIYQLARKYFEKVSLGIYLLMSLVFVAGSSIVYLAHYGNVYSMPIMLGLLLGVTGLTCWLIAGDRGTIRKRYLVIGAFSIALVMGCRPQLAIILLFAFPIFWREIQSGYFFSKKGIKNTCCVILPFLVIGIGLMYYNYARFENPFNFGATYNLTSNDMTHRGVVFSRNFLGIYEYLLQPLNVKSTFPFFETIDLRKEYQGYLSSEPLFGGFFAMNIIAIFSLGICKFGKALREKKVFALTVCSFISALVIIEVDIQISGLTQRYMSDFGWLLMISTILTIFSLYDRETGKTKNLFMNSIIILSTVCLFTNYFSLLMNGRYAALIDRNPYLFYIIKHAFFAC
ncbi:hypothetical protein AALB16_07910 [Lachnospiraceae bacterium 62-35]